MKVALITDTHAGGRNDNPAFNEYFINFFENQFFPYLKENDIKRVIHLGDMFDRRKYINLNTLSSWHRRVFRPLSDLVDRVDILVGNHDTYFRNTNDINSSSQILCMYDNFRIYSSPKEVEIDKLNILYVPWICYDNVKETYELIKNTQAKVCMGHFEIMGFEMHAGHMNEAGINGELFDKFFMTLSGHFHHKSSNSGIHYLGSPYSMIWSDWGDARGFHVFDTETMTLEFVENPVQIFHKLYYNDSKETYESLMSKDVSALAGKYVKVIVQKKGNPYWFDQFIEKLNSVNPSDVSVVEGVLDDFGDEDDTPDEAKDTLTILMEYVQSLSLDAHEKELSELLKDLYIEALNTNSSVQDS